MPYLSPAPRERVSYQVRRCARELRNPVEFPSVVAYPILPRQRRRDSRGTGTTRSGVSSSPPSEVHVESYTSMSERFWVGDSRHVESSSLAKCVYGPRFHALSMADMRS